MNKNTRLKTSAAKTNLNVKKESTIKKLKWRAKEAEEKHPGVIVDSPRFTIKRRARLVNVNDIAIPDNIDDIFNIFPTLGIAKIEFLEKMRMQRIVDVDEKLNFENESQEFDEEVRQDFEDTFGNEEMKERMRRQEEIEYENEMRQNQFPGRERDDSFPPQRYRKRPLGGNDFF